MRTLIALSFMLSGVSFASTVNLQLATELDQWSTLTTEVAVPGRTGAQDSLNYSQNITTDGPVRSGFLQIRWNRYSGDFFNGGTAQVDTGFTLNPFNGTGDYFPGGSPVTEIVCRSGGLFTCTPGPAYWDGMIIPVTLGTQLTLVSNGFANNDSTPYGDMPSGGELGVSFQFRFLEPPSNIRELGHNLQPVLASAVTAAPDVTAAPEPSTWGMLAAAGILGIIKTRKAWR